MQVLKEKQAGTKAELRSRLRQLRDAITPQEREMLDAAVFARCCASEELAWAEQVLCYVSCKGETDTRRLLKEALRRGKIVGVPRVCGAEMDFFQIDSLDRLQVGTYGIPEPPIDAQLVFPAGRRTLVVVPALGFDRFGQRVGYGGGYYDKYLGRLRNAAESARFVRTLGLTYEELLCAQIPVVGTDQPVDAVLTECARYEATESV